MYETDAIYHDKRYKRARAAALKRDEYLCQYCKRYGRMRQATITHHIKPVEIAPELAYSADNLVSLCMSCHNKMHPEKAKNGRKRRF